MSCSVFGACGGLIQPGAIDLHLTQAQELLSVRYDHINVAAVYPITLELSSFTRLDACDHSAPGRRRSRNQVLIN